MPELSYSKVKFCELSTDIVFLMLLIEQYLNGTNSTSPIPNSRSSLASTPREFMVSISAIGLFIFNFYICGYFCNCDAKLKKVTEIYD